MCGTSQAATAAVNLGTNHEATNNKLSLPDDFKLYKCKKASVIEKTILSRALGLEPENFIALLACFTECIGHWPLYAYSCASEGGPLKRSPVGPTPRSMHSVPVG